MTVFINQPDAFDLMVSVEGEDWRERQLNGDFRTCSFQEFLKEWQEMDQRLTPEQRSRADLMDNMGLSVEGVGAIYGAGGWSRYTVRYSGEIKFIVLQSPSDEVSDQARQAGFRFF